LHYIPLGYIKMRTPVFSPIIESLNYRKAS